MDEGWVYKCVMDGDGELRCWVEAASVMSGGNNSGDPDSIMVLPSGIEGSGVIPDGSGIIGNQNSIGLNQSGLWSIPNPFEGWDPLDPIRNPLQWLVLVGLGIVAVVIITKGDK